MDWLPPAYVKVFSALQTTMSPMVWWQQTMHKGTIFGGTGAILSNQHSTLSFKTLITTNKLPCYKLSWNGSSKAALDEEPKSRQAPSKMYWVPSARPLNWRALPTPHTGLEPINLTHACNSN